MISDSRLVVINALFEVFRLTYPGHFNGNPERSSRETRTLWASHLERFTDKQIEDGAKRTPDEFPQHPPTIGEFKRMISYFQPAHRDWSQKRIAQETSRDVSDKAIADMKRILAGARTPTRRGQDS